MKKKRQYILLAGILLLAAFLRLSNSELVLFDGDESRDSFRTMNLVENGVLPGLGSELITGGNLGPLEYYLLAFPYMISGDPEFLTGFVALLNIVAVFLLYLLGRDFFNVKVGLIAAALFAFSPPAVLYSKKIWNPYFLPLFSVLFFYCVFKVRLHKEKKYILGALPAFACMLQFHISAAFLSPFVLLLYSPGLFQKEVKKHTLFGLALFVLLFLPLLAYEVKHNFSNTKNILSGTETLVSKKSESLPEGSFFLDLIEYSSVAASNINLIPGDSLKDQCLQLTYSGGFLNASQIGVFLMALAYLLFCVISKNRHEISLYLLGWFFLPFILYFFLTTFIT
ncbi:MAG: ArnT family glycosyltransferase, partial [Nitrospinota bacterium]